VLKKKINRQKIPYERQIVKMFSESKSREKTTGINLKKMVLIKIA